jgi:hypothetical protein
LRRLPGRGSPRILENRILFGKIRKLKKLKKTSLRRSPGRGSPWRLENQILFRKTKTIKTKENKFEEVARKRLPLETRKPNFILENQKK